MDVCICGESAVELWRTWRLFGVAGLLEMGVRPSEQFTQSWQSCTLAGSTPFFQPPSSRWVERFLQPEGIHLSGPVDFISTDGQHRVFSQVIMSHVAHPNLLAQDFVAINEHVCILTPEASLMMATRDFGRVETLRLVNEFCGTYVADPGCPKGFHDAAQLTSRQSLLRFCDQHPTWKRARDFQRDVGHAVDGCASPAESTMALLLCLPAKFGGFGLPRPTMNAPICLDSRTNRLADRTHYVGDAVWPDAKVIVEYDSKAEHTDQASVTHDHIRKMALEANGYHVGVVTPGILANADLLEKVALDTGKRLWHRCRTRLDAADFAKRQRKAREVLIDVPNRWHKAWRLTTSGSRG
jgi:hypothetical protein